MNANITRWSRYGLGGAAVVGLAAVGCFAATGSLADQIAPAAHGATASNLVIKKYTMQSVITNNTGEDLTLVSASDGGGTGVHWQSQAKATLPDRSSEAVSDYSSLDNDYINLVYKDTAGNTFTFDASNPVGGSDSASGATSNTEYGVSAESGSGRTDNSQFTAYVGHPYSYTGQVQTYTVPAGVTKMSVTVVGGSGGNYDGTANGADITGTLAVTPGEVLTIGVGGKGYDSDEKYGGGWGLPFNGSSFSGGNGTMTDVDGGGGGGGASVIIANGQVLVVAGGGGGEGNCANAICTGGQGGYDNELTGQNGLHGGGQAGASSTYAGQAPVAIGAAEGGAGGGGYAGGAAGPSATTQGGGGAGSSYDTGLTGAAVATSTGSSHNGWITLTSLTTS